jgi:hypothetical protein
MRHHQHHLTPSNPPLNKHGEGQRTQLHYSVHGQQMGVRSYDAYFICEGLREEETDSRGVGGGVMICGPAGRGTLQIEGRKAQNHTNHGRRHKDCYRVLYFLYVCC